MEQKQLKIIAIVVAIIISFTINHYLIGFLKKPVDKDDSLSVDTAKIVLDISHYRLNGTTYGDVFWITEKQPYRDSIELPSEVSVEGKIYNKINIFTKAFYNCQNFKYIKISNSTDSIGEYAFSLCENLKLVKMSDSVKVIPLAAFSECKSLTDINIPNGVTTIEREAFYNCTSLKYIEIPSSVTEIGRSAFKNCTNLHVRINNSKSNINVVDDAFLGCKEVVYILDEQRTFTIESNLRFDRIAEHSAELVQCLATNSDTIRIPSKVKIGDAECNVVGIRNGVFYRNERLKYIFIDEGLKIIGKDAFKGCKNLKTVILPSSVTEIWESAFENCENLIYMEIPNSIKKIGINAFYGCSSVTQIEIPPTIENIGESAFGNCIRLRRVVIHTDRIWKNIFPGCRSLKGDSIIHVIQ